MKSGVYRSLFMLLLVCVCASAQGLPKEPGFVLSGGPVDAVKYFTVEFGAPGPIVKNAPYTAQAVSETTQVLSDGNRIHRMETTLLARDSQGRTRREQSMDTAGPWTGENRQAGIIFIFDPVAGVRYVLNPSTHAGEKAALEPTNYALERKQLAAQVESVGAELEKKAAAAGIVTKPSETPERQTESLGTQQIEGVMAQGERTTYTIPAGVIGNERPIQTVSERWYSPELQTVIMSKESDPRFGDRTYRLTNIERAEPSPDLFRPPADYNVKDSQGLRRKLIVPAEKD
jgi:hypothetical protein